MLPIAGDLPLHPAIVHLPLGLALIVPALALGLLWARHTLAAGPAWVAVAIQALVFAGALAAEQTGEDDEDRAEAAGAPETAIEAHEEAAEVFVVLSGVTLAALGLGAALRQRALGAPVLAVAALLSVGTLGQGLRVGHAGGTIVYGGGTSTGLAATGEAAAANEPGEAGAPLGAAHDDDEDEDDD